MAACLLGMRCSFPGILSHQALDFPLLPGLIAENRMGYAKKAVGRAVNRGYQRAQTGVGPGPYRYLPDWLQ